MCERGDLAMVVQYTLICRIMCRPCTQFRTFSLNRRRVQYTVVGNSVSSREHTGWLCCPAPNLRSDSYSFIRLVRRTPNHIQGVLPMCRLLGKLQSSLPESLLVVTILSISYCLGCSCKFLCVVISISSFHATSAARSRSRSCRDATVSYS